MAKYRVYPQEGNGFILTCDKITQEGIITWCDNTGYVNTPLRIERTEDAPPNETGQSHEPSKTTVPPKSRKWFQLINEEFQAQLKADPDCTELYAELETAPQQHSIAAGVEQIFALVYGEEWKLEASFGLTNLRMLAIVPQRRWRFTLKKV